MYESEGLPQAFERALRVAKTPPYGPVHLAIYDRLLEDDLVTTSIIEGKIPEIRAGYPSDEDVQSLTSALEEAERPMFYIGDGIWKSGAENKLLALAEHYGATVVTGFDDARGLPITHPLHCGRINLAVDSLKPDQIFCFGIRHGGNGKTDDFGYYVAENKVSIPDLHATILHLLGLDHQRLTFRHAGRDFRLTDVEGEVVREILT